MDNFFSDFKPNLDAHPVSGDLAISNSEQAVKTALKFLVLTGPYERLFNPLFGGGVPQDQFENFGQFQAVQIQTRIEQAIRNYESERVDLKEVVVIGNPDNNQYSVTIYFSLVNNVNVLELNVILERVR